MLEYFQNIIADWKRNRTSFIGIEIFFVLLASALLNPFVAWVAARLISMSGKSAVSNVEIVQFLMSPLGWISVIAVISLGWTVISLGHAGLLMVQVGQLCQRTLTISQAILAALRRGPALIQLAFFYVGLFLLVALPFLMAAGMTYDRLLSEYDINFYLAEKPPEFKLALLIGGILALGLAIAFSLVYARTIYAVPECILKSKSPLASIKSSIGLTRHKYPKIVGVLIGWFVVAALVSGLISGTVQLIEDAALRLAGESFTRVAIMIGLLLTLNFLGVFLVTLFGTLSQSLLIGRMYWASLEHQESAANDKDAFLFPGLDAAETSREKILLSLPKWLNLRRSFAVCFVAIALFSFAASLFVLSKVQIEDKVKVTAHRGSSTTAPENTLSAIRQAIADGADYAEIDVQETVDGVVVVLHDADFMRLDGNNANIWNTTYQDLQKVDAGRWFDESFTGERIPTLQQAMEVARGKIKLNIELKFNGHDEQLVTRTLAVIKENSFEAECVISSLNHDALKQVQAAAPSIPVGAIVGASLGDISKLNTDFISINVNEVKRSLVRQMHGQGKQLHVWTVNDKDRMSDMIDLGVDNILTDDPAKLFEVLKQREQLTETERLLLAFRMVIQG